MLMNVSNTVFLSMNTTKISRGLFNFFFFLIFLPDSSELLRFQLHGNMVTSSWCYAGRMAQVLSSATAPFPPWTCSLLIFTWHVHLLGGALPLWLCDIGPDKAILIFIDSGLWWQFSQRDVLFPQRPTGRRVAPPHAAQVIVTSRALTERTNSSTFIRITSWKHCYSVQKPHFGLHILVGPVGFCLTDW